MFWFDRQNKYTVYVDNRNFEDTLCDGRRLVIKPDVLSDFRELPYPDNSFKLAVFDPPHLIQGGDKSWLVKKYGRLNKETWREDLYKGFSECIRVLEPYGILVFKWHEEQIKLSEILTAITYKPIFGDRRSKTHWLVFMKNNC